MKHTFNISPLLQSHILEFSYQLPFAKSMKLLNTVLTRAQMGASQSQRLMAYYGQLAEVEDQLLTRGFESNSLNKKKKDILYAQVDGGHLLTDDGYRETKVGRLFKASDIKKISSEEAGIELRNRLEQSDYIAHLGNYQPFTKRFDQLIDNHIKTKSYNLVLISDGADWIARWQKEKYPSATMILDFYHALEHLGTFAKMIYNSTKNKGDWMAKQKKNLLEGNLDIVIKAIKEKSSNRKAAIKEKADILVNYYEKNRYRMNYKEYLEKGLCIGSGAIESSISTVVQQRCKLVGQRWTGRVQSVFNIRALYMSNKKDNLIKIINQQMGYNIAA